MEEMMKTAREQKLLHQQIEAFKVEIEQKDKVRFILAYVVTRPWCDVILCNTSNDILVMEFYVKINVKIPEQLEIVINADWYILNRKYSCCKSTLKKLKICCPLPYTKRKKKWSL